MSFLHHPLYCATRKSENCRIGDFCLCSNQLSYRLSKRPGWTRTTDLRIMMKYPYSTLPTSKCPLRINVTGFCFLTKEVTDHCATSDNRSITHPCPTATLKTATPPLARGWRRAHLAGKGCCQQSASPLHRPRQPNHHFLTDIEFPACGQHQRIPL